MLKIGLTGGIGSGKSTTCRFFQELGAPVIDADAIAREITRPGHAALEAVALQFGTDVINDNGELDRNLLRQRIFADTGLKHKLESILHPLIKQAMIERLSQIDAPYVILAIPLLLEKKWTDLVDRILVIDTPLEQQIRRSKDRDQCNDSQIRAIIQNQTDRETRCAAADDIIHNDSDLSSLRDQVQQLHERYLSLA